MIILIQTLWTMLNTMQNLDFSKTENVICSNSLGVSRKEALCILLKKRFSYPLRLEDMVPRFGGSVSQLSMIPAEMTNLLFNMYHHQLSSLNHQWLSTTNFQQFADAVA